MLDLFIEYAYNRYDVFSVRKLRSQNVFSSKTGNIRQLTGAAFGLQ